MMNSFAVAYILAFGVFLVNADLSNYPFRNVSLDWDTRVDDLVSRLTLQEMVFQMAYGGGGSGQPVPAITRLGIPAYQFDTECLHGVMSNAVTAFPQSIGLSASFSEKLIYLVGEAIGTEVRAISNYASAHGQYGLMKGLSCFAPFINLMRHPLWGRVQEVYGEDPYFSGIAASAYVKGMQGSDPRYIRASSGCKVVGPYSGPENIPTTRFSFNAIVSERDLRLSYLPQFKACIEAGTFNLMCSYYRFNGIPDCMHKRLLTDVVRREYGFNGYVITDWGAIDFAVSYHKYFNSTLEAAAAAANAGVNLELPNDVPAFLHLYEAVQKGLVEFDRIVELVRPLFYTRMRLGEFDPPESNPYSSIDNSSIENAIHQELAVQAALQTFVLLKNTGGTLPIGAKLKNLAVIGPAANNVGVILGNYSPATPARYISLPSDGLSELAASVNFVSGCNDMKCEQYNSTAVVQAASAADLVILCLGTGSDIESEGTDREDLELPGHQSDLLTDAMMNANQPIVLLLFTAGPVNISMAKNSPKVGAIVQCFFPGQGTGEALKRTLAAGNDGSVVSPAGRSPYTWPMSVDQIPPMTNYSMEGRTYRYFKGPGSPLYPFGYGLSYSSFVYSGLVLNPATVKVGIDVKVRVNVTNLGPYDADEVVQVYVSWRDCPVDMPQIQLAAVERVSIKNRETLIVSLTIREEQLRIWDDQKGFVLNPGLIDVYVGGQQPNQSTSVSSNIVHGQLQITTNKRRRYRLPPKMQRLLPVPEVNPLTL